MTLEEIAEILPHPNADRLEIAKLASMDFQFVVGKGDFRAGQEVIYFPIDSLIPQQHLATLGLTGKLSGKDRNRLRTVKLRGVISQGLVASLEKFFPAGTVMIPDLTSALGVTKYEPPVIFEKCGNLLPLPEGQGVYDIESCDRYPLIAETLMDKEVWVSEKLEGTNFSSTLAANGKFFVNQRNYTIQPTDAGEHSFWKIARELEIEKRLRKVFPTQKVVLYGEILGSGIQGDYYGLKKQTVRFYDLRVDGHWLNFHEFTEILCILGLQDFIVPTVASGKLRDILGGKSIKEFSNGKSLFAPEKLREGIVIKPLIGENCPELDGRLLLKQRSPEYLAGNEN